MSGWVHAGPCKGPTPAHTPARKSLDNTTPLFQGEVCVKGTMDPVQTVDPAMVAWLKVCALDGVQGACLHMRRLHAAILPDQRFSYCTHITRLLGCTCVQESSWHCRGCLHADRIAMQCGLPDLAEHAPCMHTCLRCSSMCALKNLIWISKVTTITCEHVLLGHPSTWPMPCHWAQYRTCIEMRSSLYSISMPVESAYVNVKQGHVCTATARRCPSCMIMYPVASYNPGTDLPMSTAQLTKASQCLDPHL